MKWVWWAWSASAVATTGLVVASLDQRDTSDTPVWIGAPFATSWPDAVVPLSQDEQLDGSPDWSVDLSAPIGTPVRVFAAPRQAPDLDDAIHVRVVDVRPSCGHPDSEDFAGFTVSVGVYHESRQVGTVSYGFIDVDLDANGVPNEPADRDYRGDLRLTGGRWGAGVGQVRAASARCSAESSLPSPSNETAADRAGDGDGVVRVSLANASDRFTSCHLDMSEPDVALGEHDYVGYLGGEWTSEPNQPCPSGI